MSDLYIRGEGEFADIPVVDAGNPPDYNLVPLIPISVEFGTSSDPIRIWQSGSAYIDAYHFVDTQGYHHYNVEVMPLPDWDWGLSDPPWNQELGNVDTIYIGACKKNNNEGYVAYTTGVFPNPYGVL